MKLRGHETFFIRKGWLSKGLKHIVESPDVFLSKVNNPMDELGIGANMVKSLRYWMQATGLAVEPKSGVRRQRLTSLGRIINEHDRYIEEMGTLLMIHYKLACNYEMATAWYFLFQEFKMKEFTREDFVRALDNYIVMEFSGASHAERSMQDDFNCIINTYVSRFKLNPGKISPENNIDCPLGELGLIDIANKETKLYRKQVVSTKLFNEWIILAIIFEQCQTYFAENKDKIEIDLDQLLHGKNSIGKVFNMDTLTLLEILRLAELKGLLKIVRTAGLDVVRIVKKYTVEECLLHYYESLKTNEEKAL